MQKGRTLHLEIRRLELNPASVSNFFVLAFMVGDTEVEIRSIPFRDLYACFPDMKMDEQVGK